MEITAELVKALRDKTGISIMQCRKALEEADGDMEKAISILQSKSGDAASKKGDRTLGAGTISAYIHTSGTTGTMVELLCETDFVAKNEEFVKLARDIAMHATATNPSFLKAEDVDENAKQDPDWNQSVLLEQSFIKDPEVTIKNLIDRTVQKFGERIELSRFTRFSVTS